MPYKTEWVDPELYLQHKEIRVWCTYKDGDVSHGPLRYWHTLDTLCDGAGECVCAKLDKCIAVFDVRELESWKVGNLDLNEPVKNAIIRAIDSGELKPLERVVSSD